MIRQYLQRAPSIVFISYAIVAAFGVYFCMFAFRKPFVVATYENTTLWGYDLSYKSALIISQILGYALSKFIGIKAIAELRSKYRAALLLSLIGLAELALLLFALTPAPWNVFLLFFNGLPLGMIWGIVVSYIEGRRFTEILGAGLSASFIVASGAVKSVGEWLMLQFHVGEFWMPFVTGALFIIPMLFFVYLLEQIPPPNAEDIAQRTERKPMSGAERLAFFRQYALGLVMLVAFYVLLTAYRDFRDNFAPELWTALGYGKKPYVFTASEVPIAIAVLMMIGATMWIRNNKMAFKVHLAMVIAGGLLTGGATLLFEQGAIGGALWMILVGLGLYIGYVLFNCILFDRMIAAFRHKSNAGYQIYVADAFGYLGSITVLLYKDFGQAHLSRLDFFIQAGYALAIGGSLLMAVAFIYFTRKLRGEAG